MFKRVAICVFFLSWSLVNSLFAIAQDSQSMQEKSEKSTKQDLSEGSKKDCFRDFNIEHINIKEPKMIKYVPLLADYFQCRAAAKNDINECDNLKPWPDVTESCRKSFRSYQGFFGKLALQNRISPDIIAACMGEFNKTREQCVAFANAILKNDISVCGDEKKDPKGFNGCQAIISGDPSLCKDIYCKNRVLYVRAIKNFDIKECSKIGDSFKGIKLMCQGCLSEDIKICEECQGFKEFRQKYCNE